MCCSERALICLCFMLLEREMNKNILDHLHAHMKGLFFINVQQEF